MFCRADLALNFMAAALLERTGRGWFMFTSDAFQLLRDSDPTVEGPGQEVTPRSSDIECFIGGGGGGGEGGHVHLPDICFILLETLSN